MNGGNAARVTIYQLADDAAFREASVEEFWQDEESVLDDAAMGRQRGLVLYPLEIRLIDVDLEASTKFIAVAANLRHPRPGAWRHVFPVDDVTGKTLRVRVSEGEVVAVVQ